MSRSILPTGSVRLESLEDRCVPAGNLNIFFSNETLHIIGDQFANYVQIYSEYNSVYVFTQMGTINNIQTNTFVTGQLGEVQNIMVQTHEGNDLVLFYDNADNLQTINLFVDTGEGSDGVGLATNWADHPFEQIGENWLTLQGTMKVNTGNGNDSVSVDGSFGFDWNLGFPELGLEVDFGNGKDSMNIWGAIAILSLNGGNSQDDSMRISASLFEEFQNNICCFENINPYTPPWEN